MIASRERIASKQVLGLGVTARKYQGHGAKVLNTRPKDRVSEFQDIGPQVPNWRPWCEILFKIARFEVSEFNFSLVRLLHTLHQSHQHKHLLLKLQCRCLVLHLLKLLDRLRMVPFWTELGLLPFWIWVRYWIWVRCCFGSRFAAGSKFYVFLGFRCFIVFIHYSFIHIMWCFIMVLTIPINIIQPKKKTY